MSAQLFCPCFTYMTWGQAVITEIASLFMMETHENMRKAWDGGFYHKTRKSKWLLSLSVNLKCFDLSLRVNDSIFFLVRFFMKFPNLCPHIKAYTVDDVHVKLVSSSSPKISAGQPSFVRRLRFIRQPNSDSAWTKLVFHSQYLKHCNGIWQIICEHSTIQVCAHGAAIWKWEWLAGQLNVEKKEQRTTTTTCLRQPHKIYWNFFKFQHHLHVMYESFSLMQKLLIDSNGTLSTSEYKLLIFGNFWTLTFSQPSLLRCC